MDTVSNYMNLNSKFLSNESSSPIAAKYSSSGVKDSGVASFSNVDSSKKCYETTPVENVKQDLLKAFGIEDSVAFNKPCKSRVKRRKRTRSTVSTPFETRNNFCDSPNSPRYRPMFKNDSNMLSSAQKNVSTLQKLGLKYEELKAAVMKSRQAYTAHKVFTFFCLDTAFIKEFGEHLQQAEESINSMGLVLRKVFKQEEYETFISPNIPFVSDIKVVNLSDESEVQIQSRNIEESLIGHHHGSLTPPASEVGNYESSSALDESSVPKKRKSEMSERRQTRNARKNKAHDSKNDPIMVDQKEKQIVNDITPSNAAEKNVTEEEKKCEVAEKDLESDAPTNDSEYEVREIKDYFKKQDIYYYRVSWKGYESDDDTYEPVDNLTGCDEAVVSFFYKRLKERQAATSAEDLKIHPLPFDPSVKDQMYDAFEKLVLPVSSSEVERLIKLMVSVKPPVVRDREEIKDRLLKMLSVKDPLCDRYRKYYSQIVTNISLLYVTEEREKQQAFLRSWERNMNIVCSDPSPLKVENTVDLAMPPEEFIYINEYLCGPDIKIPNDPIMGCQCTDCNMNQKDCCAGQMGSYFAYNKYGRLKISLGTPVYECNKLCKCPPDCNNRVVQKGRRISLCIFRTPNKRGWGVKTLEPIKKDTFVTEYVGEVISSEEAENRGMKYDAEGCTYLFDLDYNKGEQNPYTVDAAKYGNVSHFINHSCDPNLVVYNVWINCLDPDLPKLALFAVTDIKKGEELTFDYNSGSTGQIASAVAEKIGESGLTFQSKTPTKSSELNASFHSPNHTRNAPKARNGISGKTECRCGAANCRKYFF